ncbi:MAG: MarR family transcriptional regulator [Actinobacteria bacterium]|nr:MarR family transcriptional regulator [Actinomycetota bacterium]
MADPDVGRLEAALTELNRQPSLGAFGEVVLGLERSAYIILGKLHRDGPQSIGQLADAFGLDQSTVNRQTAAMVRSGLLERIADPDGGMARKFVATAHGAERFTEHRDWRTEALGRVLSGWSREELGAFAALLERFTGELDDHRRCPPG